MFTLIVFYSRGNKRSMSHVSRFNSIKNIAQFVRNLIRLRVVGVGWSELNYIHLSRNWMGGWMVNNKSYVGGCGLQIKANQRQPQGLLRCDCDLGPKARRRQRSLVARPGSISIIVVTAIAGFFVCSIFFFKLVTLAIS